MTDSFEIANAMLQYPEGEKNEIVVFDISMNEV